MKTLPHPALEEIELARVLEALSDSTRLAVVAFLASDVVKGFEPRCSDFTTFGTKTNLTYHLAKLRDSGVTRTRLVGTSRYTSLRRDDLETRFPGLLDTLIAAAMAEPERAALVKRAEDEARALMGAAG